MSTLFQHAFAYHLYEYLLIIEPADHTQKAIQAFKRYFQKSHRYHNAIVSKGHITLMRFFQYESFEKRIIQRLQQLADCIQPFDIELQDFGSFGHTIYVDIKSTDPIRRLVAMHRQELRPLLNRSKDLAPYFVTKPHVTIARKLTPAQNDAIWPIWKRTRYHDTFRAKSMVLLRRTAGTLGYSTVRKFDFLGLSPFGTQGNLFA
ncbi:2'-5' RNA ligase family protein [Parapedobacter sp. DT-150]|uniref:2'-5' RNA ligase family protein n=1 Tax=Parapedobacter sp. DT-150 TaxID=3396162 RepID=UPI003F193754